MPANTPTTRVARIPKQTKKPGSVAGYNKRRVAAEAFAVDCALRMKELLDEMHGGQSPGSSERPMHVRAGNSSPDAPEKPAIADIDPTSYFLLSSLAEFRRWIASPATEHLAEKAGGFETLIKAITAFLESGDKQPARALFQAIFHIWWSNEVAEAPQLLKATVAMDPGSGAPAILALAKLLWTRRHLQTT